jgi:hypothetical protein
VEPQLRDQVGTECFVMALPDLNKGEIACHHSRSPSDIRHFKHCGRPRKNVLSLWCFHALHPSENTRKRDVRTRTCRLTYKPRRLVLKRKSSLATTFLHCLSTIQDGNTSHPYHFQPIPLNKYPLGTMVTDNKC